MLNKMRCPLKRPKKHCYDEEADTRMFVNVKSIFSSGHERVAIKRVNTDVIIKAIALFRQPSLVQIWIGFGTGKDKRWLPIHAVLLAATQILNFVVGAKSVWKDFSVVSGAFVALLSATDQWRN